MVHLPQEQKEQAVMDVCMRAGTVQEIADQYGSSRNSLYNWKKQLISERNTTRMPRSKDNVPREEQIKELSDEVATLASEAEILRQQIYQLQLEKDVLQKATELLKKDQGVDLDTLSNREKAIVINALRNTYSLKELLVTLKIARSSYCYQENALMNADKYKGAREKIRKKFAEAYESYGYRRIYRCVKKDDGSNYSEKVIRRLMAEEGLVVKQSKHRKYNSYQGEITPPAENLIARDFHSDRPNQKWLTDITEFHIPAGRVYLSPIIDCFDGMPVAWTIGVSPNANLVNTMLDEAIRTLKSNEFPIVHSDRGCHYRWPGWIERMEKAGLTRSMSKKGCSPDNSACEGFFGRLKNEMFYNRSWSNVSINDFINELDTYMHWYAEKRIKISLGGVSPIQYRKRLGMVV